MKASITLLIAQPLATLATVRADDTTALRTLFASVPESGKTVTIPPGDYAVDGTTPISLKSNTTVMAYGAGFHFPKELGDQARKVVFSGENISSFRWFGGHFTGHVFDPPKAHNSWEPNANTRAVLLTTTRDGRTESITFRDITSDGVAGAVISVLGLERKRSDREIDVFARNITVENCTLQRSGKFMWDYGYLWQIIVWPEDFSPAEHAIAAKYFRHDLVRGPVRMDADDDRVRFDDAKVLRITSRDNNGRDGVCFFHDQLPSNLVRGKQYFVVESTPEFVRIAEQPSGKPIRFASAAGSQTKLISDLFLAHLALYAPTGGGPGKGAADLVGCEDVTVRGCRLSALGDTMRIQKGRDIVFTGNHITGSRMGAFFLAEFCRNAVITGNTVDGTNGSRVMSVEKSCEDVTIVGNTFRSGGRGSWINQPRNFVLAGSRDDGATWSAPVDIGEKITGYDDTFVPRPGCGIQTSTGRLVVPGYTSPEKIDAKNEQGFRSRVIYSDDGGKTWRMGKPVDKDTNESQVIELADGRLMLNMRQGTGQSCRAVAVSKEGGETWSPVTWDRALSECPCQASILRHSSAEQDGRSIILFANPDNAGERYGAVERTKMTVRISYDEAQTWPVKKLIHAGRSSYSGLVRFPNGDVGLVFEGGEKHRREWVRFTRLPLAWLTNGGAPPPNAGE